MNQRKKKVAVVLCGSGYKDGSEIRESVAALWALSQHPVDVACFAPDAPQFDVINCLTGNVIAGESRNMLVEAARIARGKVSSLKVLHETWQEYAGIVLPGGFGVAKNLCDFAAKGSRGSVRPELLDVLQKMHEAGKPIAAICIAPALIGLAFRGKGFELTLGGEGDSAKQLEAMGHVHVVTRPHECHWDARHRVASTPAYMVEDASLFDIFEGIRKAVQKVVEQG